MSRTPLRLARVLSRYWRSRPKRDPEGMAWAAYRAGYRDGYANGKGDAWVDTRDNAEPPSRNKGRAA